MFKERKKTNFQKVVYFSPGVKACKPSDLLRPEGENSHLCHASALWGLGKRGLVNAGGCGIVVKLIMQGWEDPGEAAVSARVGSLGEAAVNAGTGLR